MKGVAWRKRFAEGSRFELEDIRVEVKGQVVEVSVAVPPEVMHAFSG